MTGLALPPEQARQIIEKYQQTVQMTRSRASALPGFAWLVTPCCQETNTWCAAATIQQTLRFITGSLPDTQENIMRAVGAGPGLQTVLDYINARLPFGVAYYFRTKVANQDDFNTKLQYGVDHKQPMVFTLANHSNDWPFSTGGHFTNCDGYVAGNGYLFSDPFYFQRWVGGMAADNNGYLYRSINQLWGANTQLFGTGQNVVGY